MKAQLELAHFLDDHGRDGTPFAQRAILLQPASPDEALALAGYLESKGQFADAATAAREGWLSSGSPILRSKCADLLSLAGATGELIDLLADDLRENPQDLALMERLSILLLRAGRTQEAFDMMGLSLRHPAGASRLLASYVAMLDKAGHIDLAVELAGQYLRGNACDKMAVRRELAEGLRRAGQLHAAVAFLDAQAGESPTDRELAGYIPIFLISSVRSEDWAIRDATLALLRARRDQAVETQLAALFTGGRGDELRLLVLHSLVAIQGIGSLPLLEEALDSPARRLRQAAIRSIGELGPELRQGNAGRPVSRPPVPALSEAEEGAPQADRDEEPSPGPACVAAPGAGDHGSGPGTTGPALPGGEAGQAWRGARQALVARLAIEADDSLRQALVEALHRLDPRPRQPWEMLAGRRPWGAAQPMARPLPTPAQRQRRAAGLSCLFVAAVIAALAVAPIQPSPRGVALGYARLAAVAVGKKVAEVRAPTATPRPPATPTALPTEPIANAGEVNQVLDGDTVRIQVVDQYVTVRYLGIDVPASGQPGARAAADANSNLVMGRMIYLEQGQVLTDDSGNWLRYVWLPEDQMANERMLELGYAAPSADPQDTKYQQRLADAATKAWENKAGFWSNPADAFPMAAVSSDQANIRKGPGTDQPVLKLVKRGTVLVVAGCDATGDWVAVRMPGHTIGWLNLQVVDMTVPASSLELAQ